MKTVDMMRCYSGSIAYGTNLPTSDTDIRGLFCAEPKFIRTPFFNIKEQTLADEEDGKIYELTNFMKLFVEMNPNIIELMFVDEKDILQSSDAYDYLRTMAPELLSSKVAFSFSGYAMAQLKRIRGHDKWISNPQPEAKPTQKEFFRLVHNYSEHPLLKHEDFMKALDGLNSFCILVPYGNNVYGVMENFNSSGLFNADGSIRNVDYQQLTDADKKRKPLFIVKYLAEEHKLAKEKHRNYWTWKENRNEARHELEVQFGYDTKHAMHLVRLMRMAEEILTDGKVLVKRPDAQELLDIRGGKWTLEELLAWADEKDRYIREDLYKKTDLPKTTDLELASRVLMTAQDICWAKIDA
ncbi:putative nucleotidyltransferase [Salmonella phage GEC_vB_MG]|nr:putative nucleotidyltransferase [Salmonella phage GEC_vB_MG]WNT48200.1 nucleotidyltransferase [Salmonella phage SPLA5a]